MSPLRFFPKEIDSHERTQACLTMLFPSLPTLSSPLYKRHYINSEVTRIMSLYSGKEYYSIYLFTVKWLILLRQISLPITRLLQQTQQSLL